jgi:hypothetical protein
MAKQSQEGRINGEAITEGQSKWHDGEIHNL